MVQAQKNRVQSIEDAILREEAADANLRQVQQNVPFPESKQVNQTYKQVVAEKSKHLKGSGDYLRKYARLTFDNGQKLT